MIRRAAWELRKVSVQNLALAVIPREPGTWTSPLPPFSAAHIRQDMLYQVGYCRGSFFISTSSVLISHHLYIRDLC
jgi:hypothetical protein